jgi:RimJ/RimL family protein N-acetyltransferase
MEVRKATIEDSERIARGMKMVADEERWLATQSDATVEGLTAMFRAAIEHEDNLVLVIEEGSELAGSIGLHPTHARGVYSLGMWLLPRWRGRGGGRMLMEAALRERPAAAHKIELEVFPDNEAAIALYRSMGFEQEGLRRDHYRRLDGTLRSALIMARLFDPGA